MAKKSKNNSSPALIIALAILAIMVLIIVIGFFG